MTYSDVAFWNWRSAGTLPGDRYPRSVVPILLCPACGHEVLIPYRHFLKSATVEPYWPHESPYFGWVCDYCGRYTATAGEDLHWTSLPLEQEEHRAFWRVEIACDYHDCASSVIAHIQTFGQTSRRNLGLMIALSSPAPVCEHGHSVSREASYPKSVDFVEWNGLAEYLT